MRTAISSSSRDVDAVKLTLYFFSGPNCFGHVQGIATYVITHPDFGLQIFGGNLLSSSPTIKFQPRDSMRKRLYLASVGIRLSLDAGVFSQVEWDADAKTILATFAAAPSDGAINPAAAPQGRLVLGQPARPSGVGTLRPTTSLMMDAGTYVVPFSSGSGVVPLTHA